MTFTGISADGACNNHDPATQGFTYNHTMLRVKDPAKSLDFYTRILGMTLVRKSDYEGGKFSLYFLVMLRGDEQNSPTTGVRKVIPHSATTTVTANRAATGISASACRTSTRLSAGSTPTTSPTKSARKKGRCATSPSSRIRTATGWKSSKADTNPLRTRQKSSSSGPRSGKTLQLPA